MRLIDAHELEREMYRRCIDADEEIEKGRAKWDSGLWIRYKVFEEAITLTPTVEAVEVVRCKDCKKWETINCPFARDFVKWDGFKFCAWGERGEDEADRR